MPEEKKLVRTPQVTNVQILCGGAIKMLLPHPGHLIVAELPQLPCAAELLTALRMYFWEPPQSNKWFADHAHTAGVELLVCCRGHVEVELHDGFKAERIVLQRAEALFLPTMVWHKVGICHSDSFMTVLTDVVYDREKHYEEDFASFVKHQKALRL